MNEYIRYIFEQNVLKSSSKQFNTYVKQQLLQLKVVDFTKMYKHITTSPILFNQLNLLMAKNVIKYSPANCTIQLSLPNVMVYQRMQKLIRFANKSLDKHVGVFVREWIEQGLQNGMGFPVMFDKLLISKVFMNSQPVELSVMSMQQQKKKGKLTVNKGKITQTSHLHQQKKQVQQSYNYHRLVYEYKSTEKSQQKEEKHNNIEQHFQPQVEVVVQQKKHKSTAKNSKKTINNNKQSQQQQQHKLSIKQQPQYEQYMLNIQQLTRLYQSQKAVDILNSRLSQKQKRILLFQFIQLKDRQQIMQQLRWQKQQQYLAQILGANCLLVFNLIKKYPYISQKQLIKLTLMQVLQTRQGLNQLVQKGLVYFYYENSRSIVYKVGDSSVMYKGMVDTIAKTIMNLSLVGERISQLSMCSIGGMNSVQINKQKLIQLQCEIQRLDDILVLFGY